MKLLRYNPEQLKLIIDGIILGFEYINTFDANYCPTIYIVEFKEWFRFEILWNEGTHINDDDNVKVLRDKFELSKETDLAFLAFQVNETLDQMTSIPFNKELDDDDFNTSNND